jgi:hypothetical protein
MDGDELVAVPTLKLVKKPRTWPSSCAGIHSCWRHQKAVMLMSVRTPFLKPSWLVLLPALVLPVKWTYSASVRARNEFYVRAGVHPALHRSQRQALLVRGQFGNVIRNDPARPRLRSFRFFCTCAGSESAQTGHVCKASKTRMLNPAGNKRNIRMRHSSTPWHDKAKRVRPCRRPRSALFSEFDKFDQ